MPKKRKTIRKKQLSRVSIEVEPRDEIDWDRFVWALFQYCRIQLDNESEQAEDSAP